MYDTTTEYLPLALNKMLELQIHARKGNAQNCKAATPVVNALSRDNPGCATLKGQSEEINKL
jgi:hypothetical protein